MKRGIPIFLLCVLLVFNIFLVRAQEEDVEALPPEPSEEEIPDFEAEEGIEEALPAESPEEEAPAPEVEAKPVDASEASVSEPPMEKREVVTQKRVIPEESIPEGMELVLRAYEVKEGDCLHDIANRYYGDPHLWRRIWSYNKYIKDPNWIFPGNDLIIPTYEKRETGEKEAEEPEVKLEEVKPGTEYEKDIFIAPPDFKFDGHVVEIKEKKLMTAYGDIVFIDMGKRENIEPKTRCTIYREGDEVIHPTTGEVMGIMVEKIGILEVTSDVEEDSSTALIIDSRKPVEIGDSIKLQLRTP